jgi:hypothetical protein
VTRAVWLVGIIVLGAACSGTTTDDQGSADSATTVTLDPRLVPTTSTQADPPVYSGPAVELLPQLGVEMSRLSSQISEDGDEDKATVARITALWAAAHTEVEATRPDLLESFQTTVDMATSAVERNRPADADKAFSNLSRLIDNYTGDG